MVTLILRHALIGNSFGMKLGEVVF